MKFTFANLRLLKAADMFSRQIRSLDKSSADIGVNVTKGHVLQTKPRLTSRLAKAAAVMHYYKKS